MMRRLAFSFVLAAAALSPQARPAEVRAEDVLALALRAASAQAPLAPGYCWLEEYAIGIRLVPVPAHAEAFPRLLAAGAPGGGVRVSLYQLGPGGGAELLDQLKAGDDLAVARFEFTPRKGPIPIGARATWMSLGGGDEALLVEWAVQGLVVAVLFRGQDRDAIQRRRDEVLGDLVMLEGGGAGLAPLLLDGRYACVLPGWTRNGTRFFCRTQGHWLGLRFFHLAPGAFPSQAALQFELEDRLQRAGFRRSDGQSAKLADADAFLGEYFGGADGFVQRIWYAGLRGGYLVALMQAPESAREDLAAASRALATSFARIDLDSPPAAMPGFSQGRALRCAAWQDGARLHWGALFDDARGGPVLWRQPGVEWSLRVVHAGREIAALSGRAASSRDLNPLAGTIPVELPDGLGGALDVALRVGGLDARTRVTLH